MKSKSESGKTRVVAIVDGKETIREESFSWISYTVAESDKWGDVLAAARQHGVKTEREALQLAVDGIARARSYLPALTACRSRFQIPAGVCRVLVGMLVASNPAGAKVIAQSKGARGIVISVLGDKADALIEIAAGAMPKRQRKVKA